MLPDQGMHSLQDKIYSKRFADPVGKDLLREGIQDGRQVAECAMVWDIGNVCQEHFPCTVRLKFPVKQVSGSIDCLKRFRHPAVRAGLPDWAEQPVFVHRVPYLLHVHLYGRVAVEKAHINASCPFLIAAVTVSFQYQCRIRTVLLLTCLPAPFRFQPAVVPCPWAPRQSHRGERPQLIFMLGKAFLYDFKFYTCLSHGCLLCFSGLLAFTIFLQTPFPGGGKAAHATSVPQPGLSGAKNSL